MAAASDLGGSAASSAMVLVLLASMVEFEDAAIGVSSNKKVPAWFCRGCCISYLVGIKQSYVT